MTSRRGQGSMAGGHPSSPVGATLHVLGIAQDGGVPHVGCDGPCCAPAWEDPRLRRHAASAAVLLPPEPGAEAARRWLIDATPDLRWQLRRLDAVAPPAPGTRPPALEGILLTHAHFGHVAGLAELGREALGARGVPVYAMPRLFRLLGSNAPWARLVEDAVIELRRLEAGRRLRLGADVGLTPLPVPHRTALSETVAFRIDGPSSAALWLPDLDAWDDGAASPRRLLSAVDRAYVDGTFFDARELPERDRSRIAHPTIEETLARVATWTAEERDRLRFIHLNHSNPALRPDSPELAAVQAAGCDIAVEGEWWPL